MLQGRVWWCYRGECVSVTGESLLCYRGECVRIAGESVLVCQESERVKATRLLSSQPLPVTSCLQQTADDEPSYQLKRAILEVMTLWLHSGSFLFASFNFLRVENGRRQP